MRRRAFWIDLCLILVGFIGISGCDKDVVVWLPDSSGFVFIDKRTKEGSGGRLIHFDLKKNATRIVYENAQLSCLMPAISPDGKIIALARLEKTTVAGSRTVAMKLQVVLIDFNGREVKKSIVRDEVQVLDEAATESNTRLSRANLYWGGHPDRLVFSLGDEQSFDKVRAWIYDRVDDSWIAVEGLPVSTYSDLRSIPNGSPINTATEKGFFVALTPLSRADGDPLNERGALVDWDGWVHKFNSEKPIPILRDDDEAIGVVKEGSVYKLMSGQTLLTLDTDSMKAFETRHATKQKRPVEGKALWWHEFPKTGAYLVHLKNGIEGGIEIQIPSKRMQRSLIAKGEFTDLSGVASPDGQRIAVWGKHPGEKEVFDPKTGKSKPRVPPIPSKNLIYVFNSSGNIEATIHPQD